MVTSSHFSNKQIKCDNDSGHISSFGGHILDLVKWVKLLYYSFLSSYKCNIILIITNWEKVPKCIWRALYINEYPSLKRGSVLCLLL